MKNISWKIRVTLWYTSFVILISAFAIFLVTRYAEQTFNINYEEELQVSLEKFIDDLEIEDSEIDPGDDGFYEETHKANPMHDTAGHAALPGAAGERAGRRR